MQNNRYQVRSHAIQPAELTKSRRVSNVKSQISKMPLLEIGDPAPWFSIASTHIPLFNFSTVAGRPVVLFFFGSAAFEQIQVMLKSFEELSAAHPELADL